MEFIQSLRALGDFYTAIKAKKKEINYLKSATKICLLTMIFKQSVLLEYQLFPFSQSAYHSAHAFLHLLSLVNRCTGQNLRLFIFTLTSL